MRVSTTKPTATQNCTDCICFDSYVGEKDWKQLSLETQGQSPRSTPSLGPGRGAVSGRSPGLVTFALSLHAPLCPVPAPTLSWLCPLLDAHTTASDNSTLYLRREYTSQGLNHEIVRGRV